MALSDDLNTSIKQVKTVKDFARFVRRLREAYERDPEGWVENDTLELFLQGMSDYAMSMRNAYENQGLEFPDQPTWSMFAEILFASMLYE